MRVGLVAGGFGSSSDEPAPASDRAAPTGLAWSDWAIAVGFLVLALGTRWPMRTAILAYWDSILYARALSDFNVVAHQPQPPGYLFYVLTARLVQGLIGGDANAAYVGISLVAASGTVAAVYLVGAALFNRASGLAAALFAITAPAPWSYSGVAYPYTVLALGSTLLGGLAWALRGRRLSAGLAGLLLGLLGGFRQDLLLFLGPLGLASLGRRPRGEYIGAAAGLAVGCLAWFVPTAAASGGLEGYLGALTRQTALVEQDTSVLADGVGGLGWNLDHLRLFLVEQTLMWATAPLLVYLATRLWRGRLWRAPADRHLLLWSLPALLFYSLIHLGDVGYVFSIAPPLFIAAGAGCVAAARWASAVVPWRASLPLGLRLTPGLLVWAVLAAGPALSHDYYVYHTGRPYSLLWSRCRDQALAGSIALVRERYRPDDTVLVAAGYYQHARHYLPAYPAWLYDPIDGPVFRRPVPPGVRHVVAFGYRMATRGQPIEERTIVGCDVTLSIFHVQPGQVVVYQPDELWIDGAAGWGKPGRTISDVGRQQTPALGDGDASWRAPGPAQPGPRGGPVDTQAGRR